MYSDEYPAIDANGSTIHRGDTVIWTDPEKGYKTEYKVFGNPDSDMVKLHSRYGECEALPEECVVIKTVDGK